MCKVWLPLRGGYRGAILGKSELGSAKAVHLRLPNWLLTVVHCGKRCPALLKEPWPEVDGRSALMASWEERWF